MIGSMLAKARKSNGIKKSQLASLTNINVGHLTHIEKGERNPSHKALKCICKALNIPYGPLMFTYDKELSKEQISYNAINYISCNKILAIDNISSFIDCPPSIPSSTLAVKINDDSMEPTFKKGDFIFIELNSPLNTKDYGIFSLNNEIIIRRFYSKNGKITLKADNKSINEIKISETDTLFIIGKVLKIK